MTSLHELWKDLKFVSNEEALTEDQRHVIAPILEEEKRERDLKRIRFLLQRSGIKRAKTLSDFDWTFNPKLPHDKIMKFLQSPWIENASNLVLMGPSGVGKSHIASAIAFQAVQEGYPTVFISSFDLVEKLKNARRKDLLIQYYSTVKVFCLDELGYIFPSQDQANDIFQIISKRSEIASTLITTNLVPSSWGKLFDTATATAILDRLNLNGTFLTFEGRSYRSKKS